MFTRAGVLENVKNERNAVFEDEQVHDKAKTIISTLMSELKQAEASNGTEEVS